MKATKEIQGILGTVAKKVVDTAIHAAIFSYVSKKVSSYMDDKMKKEEKIRVDSDPIPTTED